jgi:ankyrin repeat protein
MKRKKIKHEKKRANKWERRRAKRAAVSPEKQRANEELLKAVRAAKPEAVKQALEKGADPGCRDSNQRTPIFRTSNVEILRILVAAGADINAKDRNGNVALFGKLHPWYDDTEGAEFLMLAGADVNVRNKNGESIADLIRRPVASALENNIANSYIELAKRFGFKE